MKKTFSLFATITLVTTLLPASAGATSYNQGYTCHHHGMYGRCTQYQRQNPYYFNTQLTQPSFAYIKPRYDRNGWKWYYDERDGVFRSYLRGRGQTLYYPGESTHIELDYTRYRCTGSHCGTPPTIRY